MARQVFAILFVLMALPAFAEEDRSWWKLWLSEQQQSVVNETTVAIGNQLFTEDERSILNDYLRQSVAKKSYGDTDDKHSKKDKKDKKDKKQKALPPGLQKKVERGGELPPGWQKKITRGEVLGKDLYLASKGLPQNILNQLPLEPDGTTIRQIDDTIVRVMEATDVILDVLLSNTE